jgi:hypothetical protein
VARSGVSSGSGGAGQAGAVERRHLGARGVAAAVAGSSPGGAVFRPPHFCLPPPGSSALMHACSGLLMRAGGVTTRALAQGRMAAANTHAEWQRNASEMEALVHANEPHWERTLFDYELVAHRLEVRY